MASLGASGPHFVRCVKPNPAKRPRALDRAYSAAQLRCGGVMDAERFDDRILRHGFVWLIAAFSAAGGLLQGYAIGLVGGLQDSSPFKKAFPGLLPHGSDRTPTFVIVFLAGAAVLLL